MKGKKLTRLEFIVQSKNIHGDKYDYSLINYLNIDTKVKIICSKHGIFEQTPKHHLKGSGCLYCSNENKKHINIIDDLKKTHNNKYIYDLVVYKNMHTKIKIICPKHGLFEQTPNMHLRNRGCPKCAGFNKSHEDFIIESNIKHNNKYKYPEKYNGCYNKITIICPIHGEFKQTPKSHLNGSGCLKCGGIKVNNNEDFIIESNIKHNNKYKYPEKYNGCYNKITIICPIHGEFKQTPNSHLSGQGCSKCSGTKKHTHDEFIELSNNIHGQYEYNDKYINSKYKITIICPIHGEFKQRPNDHLSGAGCPKCYISKGEKKIEKILIEKNINFIRVYKFDNCKYIKQLKFDFYLPLYNLCIEYDGEQHFKSNKYFGGDSILLEIKQRDKIKNEYCENNNIRLIRIPYIEYNNIEYILIEELKIK